MNFTTCRIIIVRHTEEGIHRCVLVNTDSMVWCVLSREVLLLQEEDIIILLV